MRQDLAAELARLDRLIADHPCFHADATLTRLSAAGSPLLALRRESAGDGGQRESVLVLVNLDPEHKQSINLEAGIVRDMGSPAIDLLGQDAPALIPQGDHTYSIGLGPGESYCLAATATPNRWAFITASSAFFPYCAMKSLPAERSICCAEAKSSANLIMVVLASIGPCISLA